MSTHHLGANQAALRLICFLLGPGGSVESAIAEGCDDREDAEDWAENLRELGLDVDEWELENHLSDRFPQEKDEAEVTDSPIPYTHKSNLGDHYSHLPREDDGEFGVIKETAQIAPSIYHPDMLVVMFLCERKMGAKTTVVDVEHWDDWVAGLPSWVPNSLREFFVSMSDHIKICAEMWRQEENSNA